MLNGGKRFLFSMVCAWVLNGCSVLPVRPVDAAGVAGVWETAGFVPYARLEFSESGDGVLVAMYGEQSSSLFTLKNFESREEGFTVVVTEISGSGRPEKLEGSFFNGQLNLKGVADDDDGVWFTRAERLSAFKLLAEKKLKEYGAQKQSE